MNWEKKIRAYSLKNAIEHEGKCQESSVLAGLFHEGLKREDVKSVISSVKKTVSEVNKLLLEEQEREFSKLEKQVDHRLEREGLPELPNVPKSGVVMRFSPSASGVMHLGHIITGMPTSLYVKKYGGKFYLRIEDTDPEKVDPEAYDSLPKDAEWVFGNVTEWYAQSDRMSKYYDFALELIKRGAAYICTCESEAFKRLVNNKKACPCRKKSIKDNISGWNKMRDKKGYAEGDAVLRFKSDLKNENPAMRDFPLARIKEEKHFKQGKKYRVWPLMNLCVTLDDMEFKITHIIRAKEHRDNALRQEMIFKVLGKKVPETFFLGRYKFDDLPLSKTKLKKMIEEGKFHGWDDIRMPLARNFRKRGYLPKAFEEFAIQRGLSEVDKVLSQKDFFEHLDNLNRKLLHEISIQANLGQGREIKIRMPDDKLQKKKTDLKKDKEFVHFLGLGYCHYNPELKEYWFAHK